MKTILLCTFFKEDQLNDLIDKIINKYNIQQNKLYVHDSEDGVKFITYNVIIDSSYSTNIPNYNTISMHRKSSSNTLFTINALNELVRTLNDGVLDKYYNINWEDYKNKFLKVQSGKLFIVEFKLEEIITIKK